MKKRFFIALCAAGICGAIWILPWHLNPVEPVWQGKKLSQWLTECDSDNPRDLSESARTAIRTMGTNALPYLLRRIGTRDSKAKMQLRAWAGKGSIIRRLTPTHYNFRISAAAGIEALGKEAAPAVPELIELLHDEQTFYPASLGLSAIGAPAVPLLLQALTNRSAWTRMGPEEALDFTVGIAQAVSFVQASDQAIPDLLPCLDDPEPRVRQAVASALGAIMKQPDRVVPKLMERLGDTNSSVRAAAAQAIGMFGGQARMAVPKLMDLQNDASADVRQQAATALRRVKAVSPN
jgi:hypothetical protein